MPWPVVGMCHKCFWWDPNLRWVRLHLRWAPRYVRDNNISMSRGETWVKNRETKRADNLLYPCIAAIFLFSVEYYSQGKLEKASLQEKMFPQDLTLLPTHMAIPHVLEQSASVLQWSWCWPEPWWSQQISWQDLDFSSLSWDWIVWNSFRTSHSSSCASAWCLELPCSSQVFHCTPALHNTL